MAKRAPRTTESAQIIQFPPQRTCFRCSYFIEQTSYCDMYEEHIDSEIFAAKDCDEYDPE